MQEKGSDTPQSSGRPQANHPEAPPKVVPTSPDIPSGLDPGPQPPSQNDINRDNNLVSIHRKYMSEVWNRTDRPADPGNNTSNQEKDSEGKH